MFHNELTPETFDIFDLDTEQLHSAIKQEVSLVQSKRFALNQKERCCVLDQDWLNTKEDNVDIQGKPEDLNIVGSGDSSRIIHVSLHVCKSDHQAYQNENQTTLKETERVFTALCWQHGIPFLPTWGQEKYEKDAATEVEMRHNRKSRNNTRSEFQAFKEGTTTANNPSVKTNQSENHTRGKDNQQGHTTEPPRQKKQRVHLASLAAGGAGGGKRPSGSDSSTDTSFKSDSTMSHEPEPTTESSSLSSLHKEHRERKSWKHWSKTERKINMLPVASRTKTELSSSSISVISSKDPKDKADHHPKTERGTGRHMLNKTINLKRGSLTETTKQALPSTVTNSKGRKAFEQNSNISEIVPPVSVPSVLKSSHNFAKSKLKTESSSTKFKKAFIGIPKERKKEARLRKPRKEGHLDNQQKTTFVVTVENNTGESRSEKTRHEHPTEKIMGEKIRNSFVNIKPRLVDSVVDVHKQYLTERNNEWLEWTSSGEENSLDEDEQEKDKEDQDKLKSKTNEQLPVQPDLQAFLDSTRILDMIMRKLGLNPYTRVVRGNKCVQVMWVPKSLPFFGVCLVALIFLMETLSTAFSIMTIYATESRETDKSMTQRIIGIEFVNHLIEVIFHAILTLFLTIWAVSLITELGVQYASFMSRFNLTVCLIKYDVSRGIHPMVVRHLCFVGSFSVALILVFFGGGTTIPSTREGVGFLGFNIVRPFDFKARESAKYPLVEILGLIVFLYSFLCFNLVLLQFAVYGKALHNMAKRFNLRLVFCLGKVAERMPNGTFKCVRKVIPYQKLYTEQLAITSLFRYLGHVNQVAFGALRLSMGMQFMLAVWIILWETVIKGLPDDLGEEIPRTLEVGSVKIAVPLRQHELGVETFSKAGVIIGLIMFASWAFEDVMHKASENLHTGIEYVRRHGLVLCRNAKERRFILSMICSFPPKATFWVGKSVKFSRPIFLGFLSFITATSMVFATFNPSRTGLKLVEVCDVSGSCVVYRLPEPKLHLLYVSVFPKLPDPPPNPVLMGHRLQTNEATNSSSKNKPHISRGRQVLLLQLPCLSSGAIPTQTSMEVCTSTWNNPNPAHVYLPYLFHLVEPNLTPNTKYVALRDSKLDTQLSPSCPFSPWLTSDSFFASNAHVDCFGKKVTLTEGRDDCGNLNISLPSKVSGKPTIPKIRLISTAGLSEVTKKGLICCYEYAGLENQLKWCNMPSPSAFNALCSFGSGGAGGTPRAIGTLSNNELQDYQMKLFERVQKERNGPNYLKNNEAAIRGCLCKMDGTQPNADELEECVSMFPSQPRPVPIECGSETVDVCDAKWPEITKIKLPKYLIYHPKIRKFELQKRFIKESNKVSCPKDWSTQHLRDKKNLLENSPTEVHTDCNGNDITMKVSDRFDDCLTPAAFAEDPLASKPPPKVELIDIKGRTNEFPGIAGHIRFLCCFQFPDFPDQVKYCNMPNVETINLLCKDKINDVKLEAKQVYNQLKSDILAKPFTDPTRIKYTQCYCEEKLDICKGIING